MSVVVPSVISTMIVPMIPAMIVSVATMLFWCTPSFSFRATFMFGTLL